MKYFFLLIIVFPIKAFANDWVLHCPSDINNSGECAKHKEKILLDNFPSIVSRKDGELEILTQKGKIIQFKNTEVEYFAVAYIQKANLILIRIQYWEGNSYYIVDTNFGGKWEINGFPLFNSSYSKFVTTDYDLEAQYNPNNLSVFSNNGIWHKEYYLSPIEWGAKNPQWISDKEIHFQKVSFDGHFKEKLSSYSLIFNEGNWWLKAFNKPKQQHDN